MRKKHLIWILIILISISIGSFSWNYYLIKSSNHNLVLNKSRAIFEQILVTRFWNAEHGGVYVPITPKTLPNKYLKDSLRDVVTIDGMRLTKINPAFMTRQIAETNITNYDIRFHITSLNPIRPENNADDWETKSLIMFEDGFSENLELVRNDTIAQYRYMAPLITEKACLQCHAEQGYKVGDIRGGISLYFSANSYLKVLKSQTLSMGIAHVFIFCLGVIGLLFYFNMTRKYLYQIKVKNKELEAINATKDKFFSIIAHDLRSPFNSIVGFSRHLDSEVKNGKYDNVNEFVGYILDSSNNAMDLLNNLMTWSQMESGRMTFKPENLDLVNIVCEVIALLKGNASQKDIIIENKLISDIKVFADKDMISTVVRNLISNAIKFTKPEGVIEVLSVNNGDHIKVSISDNGVGIPQERIDKLFKINENTSTEGTEKEKGTGLGLILCKEFIEQNNGNIFVESVEGEGSVFSFSLPISTD